MNSDVHTRAHPHHPVDGDIAKSLQLYHEGQLRLADEEFERIRTARPTAEERRFTNELKEKMFHAAGVDVQDLLAKRSAFRNRRMSLLHSNNHVETAHKPSYVLPVDYEPASPQMADPSFWYASANWFSTDPYRGSFDADGLNFKGLKTYDSGDLIHLYFGYTARWELKPDRIPPSSSGRWRSSPHVEIFGSLLGESHNSFGFGDDWCKCWMIRRQTVFQFVFAPPGADNMRRIAEKVDVQTIFFSEDAPFSQFWNAPGFQPLPELIFDQPFAGQSIWVETEVRFDIQLEGDAILWIDPGRRFLIRGFQWPAVPI